MRASSQLTSTWVRPVIALAVLALLLAGCGGAEDTDATDATTDPTTEETAADEEAPEPVADPTEEDDVAADEATAEATEPLSGQLVFAGFGSVFQETMEAELIPAFEEATGVDVVYETGTASVNFAKVQGGAGAQTVDVLWANALTQEQGVRQGLYAPLPAEEMPNLGEVFDSARLPDDIGVIMGTYATGLEIRRDLIDEAGAPVPTSWADLWDPAYAGHVALYDISIGFTQDVLPFWGDVWGASEDDMSPLFDKLAELAPDLVGVATAPPELNTLLQSGEVWITYNSNNRVFDLAREGTAVEWIAPEEGAVAFANSFNVVEGAPNPRAAAAFIDFMLSEEAQMAFAEGIGIAPIRPGLSLPPDLAEATGYDPEEGLTFNVVPPRTGFVVDNLADWTDQWAQALS